MERSTAAIHQLDSVLCSPALKHTAPSYMHPRCYAEYSTQPNRNNRPYTCYAPELPTYSALQRTRSISLPHHNNSNSLSSLSQKSAFIYGMTRTRDVLPYPYLLTGSSDCRRRQQVKFSVPTYQKLDIPLLCNEVIQ